MKSRTSWFRHIQVGKRANADHCPECELGVLPPFGSQYEMLTLVDEALAQDDEITFEGNSHSEAIRMKFADFKAVESPLVVPFSCQSPESFVT